MSSPQVTVKKLHRPVLASCVRCRCGRDVERAHRRKCPSWSSEQAGLDAQIPRCDGIDMQDTLTDARDSQKRPGHAC